MAVERLSQPSEIDTIEPQIAGAAYGKNLLSMRQLDASDIQDYLEEAYAAEALINDPNRRGACILPHAVLKAVMRQPSTRTGGSCTTAMQKLGGSADLISGMHSSSEAKGETIEDSWVAFATQADILGIRTSENQGPKLAAIAIAKAINTGQLIRPVPVINLGDGTNEHPTQALGDMFTIHKKYKRFSGLVAAVVGDHERYRAHHSFILGAATLNMRVIAVESPISRVPLEISNVLGARLEQTEDLDSALKQADILYVGRNPDEYSDDDDPVERLRSQQLQEAYIHWTIDYARLQLMSRESIVLHPRPRRNELSIDVDRDHRMRDVQQMANMIPMRMAIFARHLGSSIVAT